MNWIRFVHYFGLFGIWHDLVLISLNTIKHLYAYYNHNSTNSWITVLQIYISGILGILFCSLLVYGSHKKNTTCLIAWIILHIMNIVWGFIENLVSRSIEVSGIEFLWIILSIPLIDIVWRAKKQIDNENDEDMKQSEEYGI